MIKLGHDKYSMTGQCVQSTLGITFLLVKSYIYVKIVSCLLSDVKFGFACLSEMGLKICLHQERQK